MNKLFKLSTVLISLAAMVAVLSFTQVAHAQLADPDTAAPSNVITMPSSGSIVPTSSLVLIKAFARDNYLVRNVEFYINGEKICNISEADPEYYYNCLWETPKRKHVVYTISTRAYDYSGNFSTNAISVTSR